MFGAEIIATGQQNPRSSLRRHIDDEGIEALRTLVGGPLNRVGVGRLRLDRVLAATPEFRELDYFARIAAEFDAPSVEYMADKRDFGASRVARWFSG